MGKYYRILLLMALKSLFLLQHVGAEECDSTSLANFEGVPSAMVNGCVNAITGDYCDFHTDVVVPGILQLTFDRAYISSDTKRESFFSEWHENNSQRSFSNGWHTNHNSSVFIEHFKEFSPIHPHKGNSIAQVVEPMGSRLFFTAKSKNLKDNLSYELPQATLMEGLTNCGRGQIGGATNPKNNQVRFDYTNKIVTVITGEGERRNYYRSSHHRSPGKVDNNDTYDIKLIERANGQRLRYEYENKHQLKNIFVENSVGKTIGYMSFKSDSKEVKSFMKNDKGVHKEKTIKQEELTVLPCDGRPMQFTFVEMKSGKNKDCKFLTQVTNVGAPMINYGYSQVMDKDKNLSWKITEKKMPEGRFSQVQYYERKINILGPNRVHVDRSSDPRVERVSLLKAPVGNNGDPVITHRFFYNVSDDKSAGSTEVHDAHNNKTEYYYAKNKLTSVKRFGANHIISYTSEDYHWGGGAYRRCREPSQPFFQREWTASNNLPLLSLR